jgi:hypothetical protein
MHLIPRDLSLDSQGRLTISPIPELQTLHTSQEPTTVHTVGKVGTQEETAAAAPAAAAPAPAPAAAHPTNGALPTGSSMHLHMACTGTPSAQKKAPPPNKASTTTDTIVGFDLLATNTHSNFVRVAYDYDSKMLQVLLIDCTYDYGSKMLQVLLIDCTYDYGSKMLQVLLIDGAINRLYY